MNSREIELKKLGFELNNDQRCFYQWEYNSYYIFDFYDVENLSDERWNRRTEQYKNDCNYISPEYLKQTIKFLNEQ